MSNDIRAWLDAAIARRERHARLAAVSRAGSSNGGRWEQRRDEHHSGYMVRRPALRPGATTPPLTDAVQERVALVLGESEAEHIVANNPESVLRRCAADRKLINLHDLPGNVFPDSGYMGDNRWCVGCGYDSDGEPRTPDISDCPTLNALAEGYGWTETE